MSISADFWLPFQKDRTHVSAQFFINSQTSSRLPAKAMAVLSARARFLNPYSKEFGVGYLAPSSFFINFVEIDEGNGGVLFLFFGTRLQFYPQNFACYQLGVFNF